MTVFTAIKAAVLRTTGVTVTAAFTDTQQISREMCDLSNEVAADIASSHDWRGLTKVAQITGTGATAYPLPSDYSRMLLSAEVDDAATWFWGYEPFSEVNEWMRYVSGTVGIFSPGGWIILGGQLQFYPAPSGVAQYPYISTEWARSDTDVAQSEFLADTDTFVLPERLLTLGLIWRWMDQKGLPYSEALATYEMALAQAQTRDKGARVLRSPTRRQFSAGGTYINRGIG